MLVNFLIIHCDNKSGGGIQVKRGKSKGATALRSNASPFRAGVPSGRIFFWGGGLKGNCQKKYTMEVKTVKARKSDKVVSKRSKSTTIWD